MSQQGLILVHTEKLEPKGPISERLVSSDISHVAFASVLLGENPSEEVDDYNNCGGRTPTDGRSGYIWCSPPGTWQCARAVCKYK